MLQELFSVNFAIMLYYLWYWNREGNLIWDLCCSECIVNIQWAREREREGEWCHNIVILIRSAWLRCGSIICIAMWQTGFPTYAYCTKGSMSQIKNLLMKKVKIQLWDAEIVFNGHIGKINLCSESSPRKGELLWAVLVDEAVGEWWK